VPGRLTPRVLVYQAKTVTDPRISPDASRIAYVLSASDPASASPRAQLLLCRRDGTAVRTVAGSHDRVGCPRWSPDGTMIACTGAGPRPGTFALLAGDPDGDLREVAVHQQPLSDLAWSPDATRIAWTALFDPTADGQAASGGRPRVRVTRRIDYKDDGRGYLGDARKQIFITDLRNGQSRRVTNNPLDHNRPAWSPDGRLLAAQMPDRAVLNSVIALIDPESGTARPVTPESGTAEVFAWSPDGGRLVYGCDLTRSMHPDYFVYELASGSTCRLTDGLSSVPAAPGSPCDPVWLDSRRVLLHTYRRGASRLETLHCQSGRVEVQPVAPARRSGLSVDRSGRYAVQVLESLNTMSEISVVDMYAGVEQAVTHDNRSLLAGRPPAGWETFQVERDGFTIDAWLLRPHDFDARLRYPVVLDIHGGPNSHYGPGFLPHQQCLASHGFLVAYANPRGSTSYGRRFAGAVVRDWGGGDMRDLLAVLDRVHALPYADPVRTGIYGYSYGGYLVAWILSRTDRFAAAVCGAPIFDLESDYGTSDIAYNGLEHYGGGPPHAEPEWYREHSPSTFAHRIRTPTLIVHGEADARCPIGQSEQMFTALKKAGCQAEFVRYPDASHMFFAHGAADQRADYLARVLAWFRAHLGGPAAPTEEHQASSVTG